MTKFERELKSEPLSVSEQEVAPSPEAPEKEEKFFMVTRREFKSILKNLDLWEKDILDLPQNAVVVDVGSGLMQEFEKGLRSLRPDLWVISIDRTLALDTKRQDIGVAESGDALAYEIGPKMEKGRVLRFKQVQEERKKYHQPGAIAGEAPNLPLASESVDVLIDSYGPCFYLAGKQDFKRYIEDVTRVLKTGGRARLYPVGRILGLSKIGLSAEAHKLAQEDLSTLLEDTNNISVDFFFKEDGVGMKISKLSQSQ